MHRGSLCLHKHDGLFHGHVSLFNQVCENDCHTPTLAVLAVNQDIPFVLICDSVLYEINAFLKVVDDLDIGTVLDVDLFVLEVVWEHVLDLARNVQNEFDIIVLHRLLACRHLFSADEQ